MKKILPTKKWLLSLPKKRVSSAVLLQDSEGHILILKPSYKDGWEFPGGVVEAGEAPHKGAERELKEEIGLKKKIAKILLIEHRHETGDPDALELVFDGGTLTPKEIRKIKIDNNEIISSIFVAPHKAVELLRPHSSRRLRMALLAQKYKRTVYAENGEIIA